MILLLSSNGEDEEEAGRRFEPLMPGERVHRVDSLLHLIALLAGMSGPARTSLPRVILIDDTLSGVQKLKGWISTESILDGVPIYHYSNGVQGKELGETLANVWSPGGWSAKVDKFE